MFNRSWFGDKDAYRKSSKRYMPVMSWDQAVLELCRGKEIYRADQQGIHESVTYKVLSGYGCRKRVAAVVTFKAFGNANIKHVAWVPTEEDMKAFWLIRP